VRKEGSSFSEEKEAKRRSSMKGKGLQPPTLDGQRFFGSVFQERTNLPLESPQ
jgi:hypothetical protein